MTNDTTTTKQRPTHTAFSVRKYKQNGAHKSSRTPIGAGWVHGDGEGFDIVLEAFPVNGRVTLRKNRPQTEQLEQTGPTEQAEQA
jgi:hypothetical protein